MSRQTRRRGDSKRKTAAQWEGSESRQDRETRGRGGRRAGRAEGRGEGGEEKRVMWRDLALESGGWFIKCSKVQVEKVRMDLTCLQRR